MNTAFLERHRGRCFWIAWFERHRRDGDAGGYSDPWIGPATVGTSDPPASWSDTRTIERAFARIAIRRADQAVR